MLPHVLILFNSIEYNYPIFKNKINYERSIFIKNYKKRFLNLNINKNIFFSKATLFIFFAK